MLLQFILSNVNLTRLKRTWMILYVKTEVMIRYSEEITAIYEKGNALIRKFIRVQTILRSNCKKLLLQHIYGSSLRSNFSPDVLNDASVAYIKTMLMNLILITDVAFHVSFMVAELMIFILC